MKPRRDEMQQPQQRERKRREEKEASAFLDEESMCGMQRKRPTTTE